MGISDVLFFSLILGKNATSYFGGKVSVGGLVSPRLDQTQPFQTPAGEEVGR